MTIERAETFERILTTREKSELIGQLFRDQELSGVDLSRADLRGARFERVLLTNCSLAGADLRGARFVVCDLHFVNLADARLGETRFDGTTFLEVTGLSAEDCAEIERQGESFQHRRASLR